MVHCTTQYTAVQRGFLLPNVFRFNGAGVNVISFMPSLKGFSRCSHTLNNTTRIPLIPNFTQIGQHMWEVWIKIYLHPKVKYGITDVKANKVNIFGRTP
jgi:hypothetical protein